MSWHGVDAKSDGLTIEWSDAAETVFVRLLAQ